MKKKIIGMIVIGTSLLLASCGSRGEVKRGADGKQVLSPRVKALGHKEIKVLLRKKKG